MKTLMILGASYTQLPLFAAAKKLGCRTIAASIPGPYPCFDIADVCAHVDISDPDAVIHAAKEYRIDGIATCGLDLGMRALGAAAEACGLPGPSREAALRASNKYLMKRALTEHGVRTAEFRRIHSAEELETAMPQLRFPVLLKAVDQMGSRGIRYCETPDDARLHLPAVLASTRQHYCLIEEFIQGELFGVEAMIQNGTLLFSLPNNSESTKTTVQSPVGHSFPLRECDQIEADLRRQITGAVRALGLDNCPVNCDCMRSGEQVWIIELTGRPGATGLSELTGAYLNTDYYELIVRLALGEDLKPFFTARKQADRTVQACLTHTLMAGGSGTVSAIHNDNPTDRAILDLSFNIEPGDTVQPYTNGRDRIGQVILTGESLAACETRLAGVLSRLQLELTDGSRIPCL